MSIKRAAEHLLVASQHEAHGVTYVKALDSAKGLVVDERVSGGTLLENTIEQWEEGELCPDQFSDDRFVHSFCRFVAFSYVPQQPHRQQRLRTSSH